MILPDVNVLVYAFRGDMPQHRICRPWLAEIVSGDARFGMSLMVLSAVIRVTTDTRIYRMPSETLAAVLTLAWRAADMTPLWFEVTLILIGIGFGPVPSLTAVAMQNVVARHQIGISVGTMNFSRNLLATMLIAALGAIVLAGTAGSAD